MKSRWSPAVCGGLALLLCQARLLPAVTIVPDTTLAAETSNNTSASSSFPGQSNGNLAPSNISKASIRTLLYPQANTKIAVNFLPWFCTPGAANCGCVLTSTPQRCNNHILTNYNSNDAAQVKKQVDDMISRGIQVAIIDWFGPSAAHTTENETAKKIRTEAETRSAQFQFVIMDDGVQFETCAANPACDLEALIISDLQYAGANFVPSPNYAKTPDGRPIMFFFNPDFDVAPRIIDWARVFAGVSSFNYAYVFENASGFTHTGSTGGFAWPQSTADPLATSGMTYLTSFYSSSKAAVAGNAGLHAYGTTYKGFNDVLAAWSPPPPDGPRQITQACGQTWLQTFGKINAVYAGDGTKPQLESLQIATWNDYDEGTALENGIDNCLSVSVAMGTGASAGVLNWSLTGDPSTVDHFTVFASADDINLMTLQNNISAATRSVDLTSAGLPAGTHLRVKVVGKASFLNHMSSSVIIAGAAPPPPPPPSPPPPTSPVQAVPSDLSSVRVFPNPWRSDRHGSKPVTFDHLTSSATVKIFSMSSHLVKTLTATGGSVAWDLTNNSGQKVASGIYMYLVTDSGQKKTGKLGVIR